MIKADLSLFHGHSFVPFPVHGTVSWEEREVQTLALSLGLANTVSTNSETLLDMSVPTSYQHHSW